MTALLLPATLPTAMATDAALRYASALPLIPDGDEAREWAEQELSNPVYATAEPTPIDRFARAVAEFFEDLFAGGLPSQWGPWLAVGGAVLVVVLILLGFLIWGRPRTLARSRGAADLFGDDETRSAADLRRAAAAHVAREEWDLAVIVRFRALARGLAERTIVDSPPGTTVHGFARMAARAFPAHDVALEQAAQAFDDVRYLRRPGTAELAARLAAVDDAVAASRPLLEQPAEVDA